jgi:hypothetical protein
MLSEIMACVLKAFSSVPTGIRYATVSDRLSVEKVPEKNTILDLFRRRRYFASSS